jgi:hypothetical protein
MSNLTHFVHIPDSLNGLERELSYDTLIFCRSLAKIYLRKDRQYQEEMQKVGVHISTKSPLYTLNSKYLFFLFFFEICIFFLYGIFFLL